MLAVRLSLRRLLGLLLGKQWIVLRCIYVPKRDRAGGFSLSSSLDGVPVPGDVVHDGSDYHTDDTGEEPEDEERPAAVTG